MRHPFSQAPDGPVPPPPTAGSRSANAATSESPSERRRQQKGAGGDPVQLGRRIKDDVEEIPLHLLLQESRRWLTILEHDPPAGWTADLLSDQRQSLKEIRDIFASPDLDDAQTRAARERLAAYCIMLRRRHGGRSASGIVGSREIPRTPTAGPVQ